MRPQVDVQLGLDGPTITADRPEGVPEFSPTIDLEGRRDTRAILRAIRRLRFPELFELKFSREFVRTHMVRDPTIQLEAKRLLEGTDPEDKFVVILHPAFKRHALMELVRNPQDGGACYYTTLVAQENSRDGYLPADLADHENLYEHLRGCIGDFRRIDQRDIDVVRYYGDRRLDPEVSCERLQELQDHLDAEEEHLHEDAMEDFHDYYFLAINTAANDGVKQYSFLNQAEMDQRFRDKPMTCNIHQRDGYRIRVKKGSGIDQALAREAKAEVASSAATAWAEAQADLRRKRLAAGLQAKRSL